MSIKRLNLGMKISKNGENEKICQLKMTANMFFF
jgi:hypothetical protein